MRDVRVVTIVLAAALVALGAEDDTGGCGTGGEPDVSTDDNVYAYGETNADGDPVHGDQVLEVYGPDSDGDGDSRPAIVFIHGTTYANQDQFGFDEFTSASAFRGEAKEARDRGFVGVTVDFRQHSGDEYFWPEMMQDVRCAVRYLRANAGELGINPDAIGVVGASNGANLAGLLGVTDSPSVGDACPGLSDASDDVQAVALLDGNSHVHHWFRRESTVQGEMCALYGDVGDMTESSFGEDWRRADPSKQVSSSHSDVAFLLQSSGKDIDAFCGNKALANRLNESGYSDVVHFAYENAPHAVLDDSELQTPFRKKMYGFFDHHLGDGAPVDFEDGKGEVIAGSTGEPSCLQECREQKKAKCEGNDCM